MEPTKSVPRGCLVGFLALFPFLIGTVSGVLLWKMVTDEEVEAGVGAYLFFGGSCLSMVGLGVVMVAWGWRERFGGEG